MIKCGRKINNTPVVLYAIYLHTFHTFIHLYNTRFSYEIHYRTSTRLKKNILTKFTNDTRKHIFGIFNYIAVL